MPQCPTNKEALLAFIEKRIREEDKTELTVKVIVPHWENLRDLLFSSADRETAIQISANRFFRRYREEFDLEREWNEEWMMTKKNLEETAAYALDVLGSIAIELACEVPFDSQEHDTLARVLLAVQENATQTFNPEVRLLSPLNPHID
ncbi:hypothetical protein F53441_8644 [Fusarium austroafricanum]|uniref:Uncharacterized protein n=1 Tax=Fusarium austroafricanum TaxID=2364996 RepID=A0A8H4KF59_9HYPO|nr:hypothetical protein F53441_8644 [Fusarium austroafricanum]